MLKDIETQSQKALEQLLAVAALRPGELVVIGCSSSEIAGGTIGKASSFELAQAVYSGVAPLLAQNGLFLAAQCCEHLNRALVLEREVAKAFGYAVVSAVPKPKAGGSFATACYEAFEDPVLVEAVAASAGLDIGNTLIGMHLRPVAVPVRVETDKIGAANVVCARTRPKYIGGEHAEYR